MKRFYEAYPSKAHPMGILASLISAMATFYPNSQDPNREGEAVNRTIIRLLAKIPTLSAWAYKKLSWTSCGVSQKLPFLCRELRQYDVLLAH